jgi:hypothetical protein
VVGGLEVPVAAELCVPEILDVALRRPPDRLLLFQLAPERCKVGRPAKRPLLLSKPLFGLSDWLILVLAFGGARHALVVAAELEYDFLRSF